MKPKRTIIVQNRHNASPVFLEIPENVNVNPGSDVHFKCKATGTPTPEVYWSRNDVTILRTHRVFQDENGGLRIQNVNHDDFGAYRCHAANSHGRTSAAAQLKVFCNFQSINQLIMFNYINHIFSSTNFHNLPAKSKFKNWPKWCI